MLISESVRHVPIGTSHVQDPSSASIGPLSHTLNSIEGFGATSTVEDGAFFHQLIGD